MWAPHVSFVTFGDDVREVDPVTGDCKKYYFTFFGPDGGSGAMPGYDGWPHVTPPIIAGGVSKNTAEITEIMTPWRIVQYGLLPDSAGAGRWRGGMGTHYAMVNDYGGTVYVNTGTSSGERFGPFGQDGGNGGILHDLHFDRGGEKIPFRTMDQVVYQTGDILVAKCSGGGGVGNPLDRPIELVQDDVLNELISIESAEADYGVIINRETLKADPEASRALRAKRGANPKSD
jgi:N-methylhydantoinase B